MSQTHCIQFYANNYSSRVSKVMFGLSKSFLQLCLAREIVFWVKDLKRVRECKKTKKNISKVYLLYKEKKI